MDEQTIQLLGQTWEDGVNSGYIEQSIKHNKRLLEKKPFQNGITNPNMFYLLHEKADETNDYLCVVCSD